MRNKRSFTSAHLQTPVWVAGKHALHYESYRTCSDLELSVGSLTLAIIPWVLRRSIIKKYKFESDYPRSPLSTYKCHVLQWGEWSDCKTNDGGNITKMKKRRELLGSCLKKKYFDEAPCICSVEDCPSTELFENFTSEDCKGADEVFYRQLGGVTQCDSNESKPTTVHASTTTLDDNTTKLHISTTSVHTTSKNDVKTTTGQRFKSITGSKEDLQRMRATLPAKRATYPNCPKKLGCEV